MERFTGQFQTNNGKTAKIKDDIEEISESEPNIIQRIFLKVSSFTLFFGRFIKELVMPPYEINEILKQAYVLGYKSFPLVGITGFIMGLVLTMQSRPTMEKFGAESWLPAMISISIVREIGPVISALICSGKVGSEIGAELASMKVTEQIDAMEVTGINPFKYLIMTRVLAITVMLPILAIFCDVLAIFGTFIGVNLKGDVSFSLFISQAMSSMDFVDVIPAVIKTVFFGLSMGLISTYNGYNAGAGTEGVGKAANTAVVFNSLMVFVLDIIVVQLTSVFI